MLKRVKKKGSKDLCLCLEDVKGRLIQCNNPGCSSPWWHTECAGLSSLGKAELDKLNFTCSLCLLSKQKFKGNFAVEGVPSQDVEKAIHMIEKTQESMKDMQEELKGQLNEIKKIKMEDSKEKEEKDRKDFYKSVTKQFNNFKDELKEEGEEQRSYVKALLKNVEKLEDKQSKVVAQVAKEVVNETRVTSYDRSLRENNVIIFGLKEESSKEKSEKVFDELFKYIGMKKDGIKSSLRLGKKIDGKERLLKVIFEDLNLKKTFLSLLYKLKNAPNNLSSVYVQHDLSKSEREQLNILLDKAKELNEVESPVDFNYRVRGPPFAFKIVKVPIKKETNNETTDNNSNNAKKE